MRAAVSSDTGSCKCPLSFIANGCSCLLTVSSFYVLIPWFLYTVPNEGWVTLCIICTGSVAIGVEFGLLPVDSVVQLSLVLSVFVLDIELIG